MPRDGGQNTLDTISNAVAVIATQVRGSVSPSSRETEIVALEYHNNTSSSYVDVADINKRYSTIRLQSPTGMVDHGVIVSTRVHTYIEALLYLRSRTFLPSCPA